MIRLMTAPFDCDGRQQYITVEESGRMIRRREWPSGTVVDETTYPASRVGCEIEEIAVSPSGGWIVSLRYSGQGEWGYDVFRASPLTREAGVVEEYGYMLELPRFSADETRLAGGFGEYWLGGWWSHPEDDMMTPARGGPISFGFLFTHRLPGHEVERHELRMDLPEGWVPDDVDAEDYFGAREITPSPEGVRLTLPGQVAVVLSDPIPPVVWLPTPPRSERKTP
jgi:hypothetical protein